MKKPLELRIFPPLRLAGDRPKDRLKLEFAKGAERRKSEAKRLTDAELAAEHWCYCTLWFAAVRDDDGYDGAPETRERDRRAKVLERFATFPHYDDEVTS